MFEIGIYIYEICTPILLRMFHNSTLDRIRKFDYNDTLTFSTPFIGIASSSDTEYAYLLTKKFISCPWFITTSYAFSF